MVADASRLSQSRVVKELSASAAHVPHVDTVLHIQDRGRFRDCDIEARKFTKSEQRIGRKSVSPHVQRLARSRCNSRHIDY